MATTAEMIVYEAHINRNIWKLIVYIDNLTLFTKGEPGSQSLFFPIITKTNKITGILSKAPPLIS